MIRLLVATLLVFVLAPRLGPAQTTRAVGGNQHPVMKGELEGVLPLNRLRPP